MAGDPFLALTKLLTPPQGGGWPFLVGEVVQCGQGKPLKVSAAGLPPLEPEDLWIDPTLNWTWMEDLGGVELLRTGDRVVLLSGDMQTYYLIGKAVEAGG